jgi:Na+/melibiose symporter-like transporter
MLNQSKDVEGTNIRELCNNKNLRNNLIFSSVIWCALIVNYYIVAFYLKYFPGDIYQNSLTMALSDILSYLISGYVLKLCGLKRSVVISLSTAGSGAVLYLFFHMHLTWIPVFIILCRAGNSMLLNIMYQTNNTLFPT